MTRIVDFSDGFTSDNAPSGLTASADSFASFVDDAAFVTDKGAAASVDDAYFNTTLQLVRVYTSTGWKNLADESTAQTFTNKVMSAASNTFSGFAHGAEVDNLAIAHGTTSAIVGVDDAQTLTNKTIAAGSNTISGLLHGTHVDNPTGAHGVTTVAGLSESQTFTNKIFGDDVEIQGTTQSTDKTTGALVVKGGVGIEKDVYIGGSIVITADMTVNGTLTYLNSTNLEITDKNIVLNKGGTDASSVGAGVTVERTGTHGSLVFDPTSYPGSKWAVGFLGSESEVVTLSAAQTLTAKYFSHALVQDDLFFTEVGVDPSTPAAGTRKLYAKNDGFYEIDSAGTVTKVGAGSGVGSPSIYGYLKGENIVGWTTDGSATVAINTTTPINGDDDYKVTFTAASQWVRTPAQALFPRSNKANTTHLIKGIFNITGTAGAQVAIRALDQSNNQVGQDVILDFNNGDELPFELMFNVTSSVTSIKLEAECLSFTAGDLFYIDDIVFDDDPLSVKAITNRQATDMSKVVSSMTSNTAGTLRFGSFDNEDGSGLYSYNDTNGEFTILKDGVYFVGKFGSAHSSTGGSIRWYVNGAIESDDEQTTSGYHHETVMARKLNSGDVVTVTANLNLNTTKNAYLNIVATADADHVVREGEDRLSEWESFTPTGTWTTNTTYSGYKRRVGDTLEVTGKVSLSGAPDATNLYVSLPSGLLVDTNKLLAESADNPLGDAVILDSGTNRYLGKVLYDSTSQVYLTYMNDSGALEAPQSITNAAPMVFATGDEIHFSYSVPIAGWTAGMPELHVLPSGATNVFSAKIANNGTASILNQTENFIQSVTRSALGNVDIVWKAGFFNQAPNVVPAPDSISQNLTAVSYTVTSTGCTIRTGLSNSTSLFDVDFHFFVERTGSDRRGLQTYIGNYTPERICQLMPHATSWGNGPSFLALTWTTLTFDHIDPLGDNIVSFDSGTDRFTVPAGKTEVTIPVCSWNNSGWIGVKLYSYTDTADYKVYNNVSYSTATNSNLSFTDITFIVDEESEKQFDMQVITTNAGDVYYGPIKFRKLS